MADIKNKTNSVMTIAGQRVKPGSVLTVEGKISGAIWNLHDSGALEVTGAEREKKESSRMVATFIEDGPTQPEKKSDEQVSSDRDEKIIQVMKELPEEAFMADGRPEVRQINEKLRELDINNISADERDRLWEKAQKGS